MNVEHANTICNKFGIETWYQVYLTKNTSSWTELDIHIMDLDTEARDKTVWRVQMIVNTQCRQCKHRMMQGEHYLVDPDP